MENNLQYSSIEPNNTGYNNSTKFQKWSKVRETKQLQVIGETVLTISKEC